MFTRLLIFFFLHLCVLSIKVNYFVEEPNFLTEQKDELASILISCGLNDIIIISAPIINNSTKYYLTSPSGDTVKLDITPSYCYNTTIGAIDISVKYYRDVKIVTRVENYRVFNVNDGSNFIEDNDVFRDEEEGLEGNEFMIGPLDEIDHGNWILSAYYQKQDGKWIEVFQVISIEIVEILPPNIEKPQLNIGDNLKLSFKHPIDNLQSCELVAPATTLDRFYTTTDNVKHCGYFIPNVTSDDIGLWRIIGVARIVYEATAYLSVNDKIT